MLAAERESPLVIARERVVIGLVATAHSVSHFYLLALIGLFPLLKTQLHVSYIELGLSLTFANVAAFAAQTPVGMLVDRIGPRKLLIGALTLHGVVFAMLAFMPTYPMLLVAASLAGLAQCAYHPADYDILNAAVGKPRVGRAFSYHTFSGYVGSAIAPPVLFFAAIHAGLNDALFIAALPGLVMAAILVFTPQLDARTSAAAAAAAGTGPVSMKTILSPAIIGLTVFFAMLNLSQSALQNFSGLALTKLYGIPVGIATAGLTGYLIGVAGGVLVGGHIADLTKHHGKAASIGFSFTAIFTLLLATVFFGPWGVVVLLTLAGVSTGMILPSRDMMVREAAPAGAVGRTFGIVTTGFNFGGMVGPMMYGALLDRGMPRELLFVALVFMVISVLMPIVGEMRRQRTAENVATVTA